MARETAFSAQNFKAVSDYLFETFQPETAMLKDVRIHSEKSGLPPIQVSALDGRLLQFFVLLMRPQCVVEIGTLGGYSALCMAQALKAGAQIFSFDKNPEHLKVAKQNVEFAAAESQIHLIEGDALHNLSQQKLTPQIVFIDADKSKYLDYYEWAVENIAPGGLIIADNTLAFGLAHLPIDLNHPRAKAVRALKAYNQRVATDARVFSVLIPTAEGMTLSIKKEIDESH